MSVTVTLINHYPISNSIGNAKSPIISGALQTTDVQIAGLRVKLNGADIIKAGQVYDQDFTLQTDTVPHITKFIITSLKEFSYGQRIDVDISGISLSSTLPFTIPTWGFNVLDKVYPTLNELTFNVDNQPGLYVYRQLLLRYLRKEPVSFSLALFYRMKKSACKVLTTIIDPYNALGAQLDKLELSALNNVVTINTQLLDLDIMWEATLKELLSLGVSANIIKVLFDAMRSDVPQDRVGAACAALLLAKN